MRLQRAATRAAVLELQEERAVVFEAWDFMDEKLLLLVGEMLKQQSAYVALTGELQALAQAAQQVLFSALRRHGLQGLGVYPPARLERVLVASEQRNFMGVTLVSTRLQATAAAPLAACNPSLEAEQCRALFTQLLDKCALLAGISGNLHRILDEYRLTERRSRALEKVLLPEIEQDLGEMTTHLEELELEETLRGRFGQASAGPG